MEQRTRAPEWFIGGPLHGEDKLVHFPRVEHVVEFPEFSSDGDTVTKCQYAARRYAIGRTMLTLWVLAELDGLDAGSLFADILLAPHMVAEGAPGE